MARYKCRVRVPQRKDLQIGSPVTRYESCFLVRVGISVWKGERQHLLPLYERVFPNWGEAYRYYQGCLEWGVEGLYDPEFQLPSMRVVVVPLEGSRNRDYSIQICELKNVDLYPVHHGANWVDPTLLENPDTVDSVIEEQRSALQALADHAKERCLAYLGDRTGWRPRSLAAWAFGPAKKSSEKPR